MKEKLFISGMHCVSCEILLEKELKNISGVNQVKVSHKKNYAYIETDEAVKKSTITKTIEKCGYSVSEEIQNSPSNEDKNKLVDYVQLVFLSGALLALVYLLSELEITRFFPNFGDKVNIFIALLLGFVASMSTCLALVGGIIMSFGSLVKVNEIKGNKLLARARPHIYFHIGRIGGFVLLGALLGLIGSKITYSLSFSGWLTILVAVIMFYIGLQVLNIVPNITKLGFHLPKVFSQKIHDLQSSHHQLAPILIGVMTFFLPCGFTQTMQLAAVVSQNPVTGGLIMGAFALGSMPVLLAVGIGSTYAKKAGNVLVTRLVGLLILFFAIYSLNSGLILTGSPVTLKFWGYNAASASAKIVGEAQVVKMDVDWTFSPNEFTVVKGVPVRWEINGINVSGCSNEIVIPRYNIRQQISSGLNVIEFTPEEEGIIPFSCWMGMLNGRFIVTGSDGEVNNQTADLASQPMVSSSCDGSCGGSCNGGAGCDNCQAQN